MLSLPAIEHSHKGSAQRGFTVSLQLLQGGGSGTQVFKGANGSEEHPIVFRFLQGRNFPFLNSFVPLPGAAL